MHNLTAPLAHLGGARPPSPDWFARAVAQQPARSTVDVHGAAIELLTWGERGKTGLLLLHGKGAHADWWDFIAPFFSQDYRVAALSWSGMGGSGWRSSYPIDLHVDEMLAAAEAAGLFEAAVKPVFVAHSFGGLPLIAAAARWGERIGGAIAFDSPFFSPEHMAARRAEKPRGELRKNRLYPSLEAALARFRFAPPQPCDKLYIADHIARFSIKEIEEAGLRRWTWRFDPAHYLNRPPPVTKDDFAAIRCPFAVVLGETSTLFEERDIAYLDEILSPGTPRLTIPEAAHHVMVDQPMAFVEIIRSLIVR